MYYKLESNIDRKIMGNCYPQIDNIIPSDVADALSSWHFPPNNTSFLVSVDRKAHKTDFLNNLQINASGFFISERVKKIFDSFDLMKHKYFPATIKQWDINYYWLHLSDPKLTHLLDYRKCTFYATRFNSKTGQIKLSSFAEYEALRKVYGFSFGVRLEKAVSEDLYVKSLDMIEFLPFSGTSIYISEKLKSALEQNQITGFIAQKADDFLI